jgi:branched-chain amino acid transport system ATP-binding protein
MSGSVAGNGNGTVSGSGWRDSPPLSLPAEARGRHDGLLVVDNLSVAFGGVRALADVSFSLPKGALFAVIGPNGAGKSTLLSCISGIIKPDRGSVFIGGVDVGRLEPSGRARHGLARTFQNCALFTHLSVRDNILVGGSATSYATPLGSIIGLPYVRRRERELEERAEWALDYFGLGSVRDEIVSSLGYHSQKRVELARALVGNPSLLLLDEPAGGLSHGEVEGLAAEIAGVRKDLGLTILLVEHHMRMVMSMAERIVVLASGRIIAEGTPAQVRDDPQVITAYLGTSASRLATGV